MIFRSIQQIKFILDQRRQVAQDIQISLAGLTRFVINDAQRAEPAAIVCLERLSGIETNVGCAGYQRVVGKTGIQRCIGNNECFVAMDGMSAKRNAARRFSCSQTLAGFKPLPIAVYQRDNRYGRIKDTLCKTGEAVKPLFGWRVQNAQAAQCCDPLNFIKRNGRC